MTFIMKHYGFVETRTDRDPGHCGGSSKFMNYRDIFTEDLNLTLRKNKRIIAHTSFNDVQDLKHASFDDAQDLKLEREPRKYRMNVSKFRAKACSYAMLRKSMLFLAFYSISFPKGFDDDLAYKVLNSALTQLRKNFGLKSYMWVMERQRNNTIHYHLLTNDYMYISDVNRVFATSIQYYVEKNEASWGNSSFEKYNGVDVKAVNKKGKYRNNLTRNQIIDKVIGYLSKYMSKDIYSESHRVWHCSRLVSALFISVSFPNDIASYIFDEVMQGGLNFKRIECFYCNIIFCAVVDSKHWIETVNAINEKVYQWFVDHDAW